MKKKIRTMIQGKEGETLGETCVIKLKRKNVRRKKGGAGSAAFGRQKASSASLPSPKMTARKPQKKKVNKMMTNEGDVEEHWVRKNMFHKRQITME